MTSTPKHQSVVMLGASGAVGSEALRELLRQNTSKKVTLLGRSHIPSIDAVHVHQHKIDVSDTTTYTQYLPGHSAAICTLGVGQPSKVSNEAFIKIDKTAVIDFATACKRAGVEHFELLSSVGVSATSSSFFLRTKGELIEELKALHFQRLSIFQPSTILTPTNRYGLAQGITLKVWPLLKPLLLGGLRKFRGIPVRTLGQAIAKNISRKGEGYEALYWDDFYAIVEGDERSHG